MCLGHARKLAAHGQKGHATDMLLLKLVLTSLLIGSASLAGRRFGPAVGGWLVGLPLTSGPVVLFLTLERGPHFAADAAEGGLLGLVSVAAFCLVYGLLAPRWGWLPTVLSSLAAFFGATMLLWPIDLPMVLSFLAVLVVLVLVLHTLVSAVAGKTEESVLPSWDLPARIIVSTAFVVLLTGLAGVLGPHLSGLIAPLPTFAGVLAVFAHLQHGGAAAAGSVHGTVIGSFASTVFLAALAALLGETGILAAFAAATTIAVMVQGISLRFLHHAA